MLRLNERPKVGRALAAASVWKWVWPETVGQGAFAQSRTFRLAIRVPDNGHSLSAIFPISPSPIGHFEKEQLGTDFGKAKPAGVRQRDQGGEVPASRSFPRMPRRAVRDEKGKVLHRYSGVKG